MLSSLNNDLEQLIMVTVSIVIGFDYHLRKSKKHPVYQSNIILNDQKKKDSVKIIYLFLHHTNTCSPSKDWLVMVRTAAGDYGKVTALILEYLIMPIDLNHFVNSWLICELLQRVLPRNKYKSAGIVYNTRVKTKLPTKRIKENGYSIDTFEYNK